MKAYGVASSVPKDTLVMHHVGYVVADILQAVERAQARGFAFIADAPFTNPLGQQVLYFDPDTTNGVLIHLTRLPIQPNTVGVGQGVKVDKIIHAGYLVRNAAEAVAWYVDKFDGVHAGGGASRRGGRNAFVHFGQVEAELIEPGDTSNIPKDTLVMHHVGYVVADIPKAVARAKARGFTRCYRGSRSLCATAHGSL